MKIAKSHLTDDNANTCLFLSTESTYPSPGSDHESSSNQNNTSTSRDNLSSAFAKSTHSFSIGSPSEEPNVSGSMNAQDLRSSDMSLDSNVIGGESSAFFRF